MNPSLKGGIFFYSQNVLGQFCIFMILESSRLGGYICALMLMKRVRRSHESPFTLSTLVITSSSRENRLFDPRNWEWENC